MGLAATAVCGSVCVCAVEVGQLIRADFKFSLLSAFFGADYVRLHCNPRGDCVAG